MQDNYKDAKEKVKNDLIWPLVNLIKEADAYVAQARERAVRAETTLETMRPVWAQGYTSDSEAAQSSSNALAQLWEMLGVDNQTAAVAKLKTLISPDAKIVTCDAIRGFTGEYSFLSNFHPAQVYLDGVAYPTVEHAYQAAKTKDPDERAKIRGLELPGSAKKAGRKVTLREDWDDVKVHVMSKLIKQKFRSPIMREKLLSTGNAYIEETNTWNDTFWGVCNGRGMNVLGTILMNLRESLKSEETRNKQIEHY